ncbi:MAG: thioredoxin family protein [Candidatus Velamenicoccus archaeovorus]
MGWSSPKLALGAEAPDFALPDVTTGRLVRRSDLDGSPALLVLFLCRHCPYVRHVQDGIARLARDHRGSGLAIVGIAPNDPLAYPEDAPQGLAEQAARAGFTFPYLFDETQEVARAYTAACTPDPFLFDAERRLVYRGQLDGARPSNDVPVTCGDVRAAIDAVLSGRPVPAEQRPAVGCRIEWRPGNEPQ